MSIHPTRPSASDRSLCAPLMAAVEKRLREELAELQVEINEEKSRTVDLRRGESFGFLGFDFRRVRSLRGVWRAHYTPKLKKRTALLRKLKDVTEAAFATRPPRKQFRLAGPAAKSVGKPDAGNRQVRGG